MTGIPARCRLRDRWLDRFGVLGEDDQRLRALVDQAVDVSELLLGLVVGVRRM